MVVRILGLAQFQLFVPKLLYYYNILENFHYYQLIFSTFQFLFLQQQFPHHFKEKQLKREQPSSDTKNDDLALIF